MTNILVLFLSAFIAAAVSGAAGFGGALLLLPLLVVTVGSSYAVPLLTIVQLVGNLSRIVFGFSQIRWRPVGLFLVGAIPFSVLGALSFISFSKGIATRLIGSAILLFIVLKYTGSLKRLESNLLLVIGGIATGFLSGLVGSAGPLGAAIFLSLGLPPVAYVSSEAVTALSIHAVKTFVYMRFISLDFNLYLTAIVMGAAMILGTWFSKRTIEKMPKTVFQGFVSILLVLVATYMVIHG